MILNCMNKCFMLLYEKPEKKMEQLEWDKGVDSQRILKNEGK